MNYDDLKNEALSALSGGMDEQTFGTSSHVGGQGQKELRDKYPKSAMVGRVASYLPAMLAGTGEERMAVRGAEHAPGLLRKLLAHAPQEVLNKGADRMARSVPVLAEKAGENTAAWLAKASARGAMTAATAGTGNALARKAVESAVPGETGEKEKPISDLPQDAAWQAGMGAVIGPLARILQKAAPAIYAHPALRSAGNVEGSGEMANDMLKQGLYGTAKGTFKPYAQGLMDKIGVVRDKLIPNAATNERADTEFVNAIPRPYGKTRGQVDLSDFRDMGKVAARKMQGAGDSARASLLNEFDHSAAGMNVDEFGNTTIGDLNRSAKEVNTRVSKKFSPSDRGKAMGDLDGPLSAEKDRLMALKDAHNDLIDQNIDRFGNTAEQNTALNPADTQSDIEKLDSAREQYGEGKQLSQNLLEHERGEISSDPHVHRGVGHAVLNSTIKALPVRTGLGVLLDRISPELAGNVGGRAADYRQRKRGNQPAEQSPSSLLEHYQEKAGPEGNPAGAIEDDLGDGNPYLDSPGAQTKKTSGNPYLDAIGQ